MKQIFNAILAQANVFIFFIGLIGAPIMMLILLIDKISTPEKFTSDWGMIVTGLIFLACLVKVLFKANHKPF